MEFPTGQASTIGGRLVELAGRFPRRRRAIPDSRPRARRAARVADPGRAPAGAARLAGNHRARQGVAMTPRRRRLTPEKMIALLRDGNVSEFFGRARLLEPADLADVLALADEDERVEIAKLLPPELTGEALTEMPEHRARRGDAGGAHVGAGRRDRGRDARRRRGGPPGRAGARAAAPHPVRGGRAGAGRRRAPPRIRRGERRRTHDRGHGHGRRGRHRARGAGEHPPAGGGRRGLHRDLRGGTGPAPGRDPGLQAPGDRGAGPDGAGAHGGARRDRRPRDGPGGGGPPHGPLQRAQHSGGGPRRPSSRAHHLRRRVGRRGAGGHRGPAPLRRRVGRKKISAPAGSRRSRPGCRGWWSICSRRSSRLRWWACSATWCGRSPRSPPG